MGRAGEAGLLMKGSLLPRTGAKGNGFREMGLFQSWGFAGGGRGGARQKVARGEGGARVRDR